MRGPTRPNSRPGTYASAAAKGTQETVGSFSAKADATLCLSPGMYTQSCEKVGLYLFFNFSPGKFYFKFRRCSSVKSGFQPSRNATRPKLSFCMVEVCAACPWSGFARFLTTHRGTVWTRAKSGKCQIWRKFCQSLKLLFHEHYAQHLITRKEFSFGVLGCAGRREFH
jgi:hypothetical protein